jgi:hypothetical protein
LTVNVIVIDWLTLFEEAATENVDVPVGVRFGFGELLPPPPHAIAALRITNIQKRADNTGSFRFGRLRPAGNKTKAAKPSAAVGIPGFGRAGNSGNPCNAAFGPVVVTVRLVVVVALMGVIWAGMKVQFAPVGSPEQENTIAVFKLGTDATVIVNGADPPADTVALVADEVKTNGAAFVPTIWVRSGETLDPKLESPL